VWEALHRQVRDAANEQERRLREDKEPYLDNVRRLMGRMALRFCEVVAASDV
jgi:hypothetical protein